MSDKKTRICQIAVSVEDLEASRDFYGRVMGMRYASQTAAFKGKTAEAVQGIPNVSSRVVWMIDDREYMQLELFKFLTPPTRPYASRRQPRDIGYSRVAFEVNDVRGFHRDCRNMGIETISPLVAIDGRHYFSMKDPSGILLEVGPARVPLPDSIRARPCGIALSVPDLQVAMESFRYTIGFELADGDPVDKGALWGETDVDKQMVLLNADTLWVEISRYKRPNPKPWPNGYRISDIGIVNIAIGHRDVKWVKDMYDRSLSGGFKPNCEPRCTPGFGGCTYVNDPQGFSVEIMAVSRWLDGAFGFRPATGCDRMLAWTLAKIS